MSKYCGHVIVGSGHIAVGLRQLFSSLATERNIHCGTELQERRTRAFHQVRLVIRCVIADGMIL